jgi:FkbM family methyltransferase
MKKFRHFLIRIYRILRKRDLPFFSSGTESTRTYGNPGAEWTLCTEQLGSAPMVYSFGIGKDISFDLALIKNHHAHIIAFDPTPESIEWLEQQDLPETFEYFAYGLAGKDGRARFFMPSKKNHISHSVYRDIPESDDYIEVNMRTIASLLKMTKHSRIDVLKMDIEGSEYEVIDQILQLREPPGQLLIEFHHRFPSIGLQKTRKAVHKILSSGYRIIHISVTGEEYSFLKVG